MEAMTWALGRHNNRGSEWFHQTQLLPTWSFSEITLRLLLGTHTCMVSSMADVVKTALR